MRRIDPEKLQADVGRRVAEVRRALDLTQEGLAKELGLTPRYVQRVEAGKENLTLRSIALLASTLRVPVASLFAAPKTKAARPGRPPKARAK